MGSVSHGPRLLSLTMGTVPSGHLSPPFVPRGALRATSERAEIESGGRMEIEWLLLPGLLAHLSDKILSVLRELCLGSSQPSFPEFRVLGCGLPLCSRNPYHTATLPFTSLTTYAPQAGAAKRRYTSHGMNGKRMSVRRVVTEAAPHVPLTLLVSLCSPLIHSAHSRLTP